MARYLHRRKGDGNVDYSGEFHDYFSLFIHHGGYISPYRRYEPETVDIFDMCLVEEFSPAQIKTCLRYLDVERPYYVVLGQVDPRPLRVKHLVSEFDYRTMTTFMGKSHIVHVYIEERQWEGQVHRDDPPQPLRTTEEIIECMRRPSC